MKKKFKDLKDFDKPREKLLKKGEKVLNNIELLSIIIGSGIKGRDLYKISEDILNIIKDKKDFNLDDLVKIEGLGRVKASRIVAAKELFKRLSKEDEFKIRRPEDVYSFLYEIRDKKQEHFVLITLDGAHRVIKKRTLFIGTLTQSIVHLREIFAYALEDRAASIIVAHNHPSGNLRPSEDDLLITEKIREAGNLMGIELLDHIIVSKEGFKRIG